MPGRGGTYIKSHAEIRRRRRATPRPTAASRPDGGVVRPSRSPTVRVAKRSPNYGGRTAASRPDAGRKVRRTATASSVGRSAAARGLRAQGTPKAKARKVIRAEVKRDRALRKRAQNFDLLSRWGRKPGTPLHRIPKSSSPYVGARGVGEARAETPLEKLRRGLLSGSGNVDRVLERSIPAPAKIVAESPIGKKLTKESEEFHRKHSGPFGQKVAKRLEGTPVVGTGGFKGPGAPKKKGGSRAAVIRASSPGSSKILGNVAKDFIDLPAQAVPSAVLTIKDPGKVVRDMPKTSPTLRLLRGDTKGIQEHPGIFALELSGAKSLVGRTGGAAARTGVAGRKVKKAASTKRPGLKLYQGAVDGPEIPRDYSRDIIQRGVQRGIEKAKERRGRDPHHVSSYYVAPRKRQEYLINKRVDDEVAMGEGLRRARREKARAQVREDVRGPSKKQRIKAKARRKSAPKRGVKKEHREAVTLATARILRTPKTAYADAASYLGKLRAVDKTGLDKTQRKQHDQLVATLEALVADKDFKANPRPIFEAADRISMRENARSSQLKDVAMLSDEQAEAKLMPYATAHMDARPSKQFWMEDSRGNAITPDDVRAHLKDPKTGPATPEPAFFSQKTGGRSAHYVPTLDNGMQRQAITGPRRTGAATEKGTFDISENVLDEAASRSANYKAAADNFDRDLSNFGLHKPVKKASGKVEKGYWRNYRSAQRAGRELGVVNNLELVPAKVGNLKKVHGRIEGGTLDDATMAEVSDVIRKAFDDDGPGQYVLVPRIVRDRMLAHAQKRGKLEEQAQNISRMFKTTVLPTSTKWVTGNVAEISLRSAMEGLTPMDYVAGKRVHRKLKKDNPRAAAEVEERLLGGQFYDSIERTSTYHKPGKVFGSKPVRAVTKPWRVYRDGVMEGMRRFEKQPLYAALGKQARREAKGTLDSLQRFFWLGEKAMADYVKGLDKTPEQVRAARYVEEVFGRWGKNSPEGKRFLMQYAPFAQWLRVALKYVYYTLPAKHPIKTAILAELYTLTEEERRKLGLTLFEKEGDPSLPDFLQGSIIEDGKTYRVQGYTSFGTAGNPTGWGDFLIPQAQSGMKMLEGKTFTGADAKNPDGSKLSYGQRLALAGYVVGEGVIPLTAIGRRLQEGGGTSEPTSTIFAPRSKDPKNFGSALDRVFNPVRPTQGREGSKGKKDPNDPLGLSGGRTNEDDPLGLRKKKVRMSDPLGLRK